jgi:hypothetical protein
MNQPAVQFLGQPHVWCGLSPSSSFSPLIPFSRQAQVAGGVRARTAWQARASGGVRARTAWTAPLPSPSGESWVGRTVSGGRERRRVIGAPPFHDVDQAKGAHFTPSSLLTAILFVNNSNSWPALGRRGDREVPGRRGRRGRRLS